MNVIPKYKIGTDIAIDRKIVLDYFEAYIDFENKDTDKPTYICKDGSFLILYPSNDVVKVFVKFHCCFQVNPNEKSINFQGKNWFLKFCKLNNSKIQNLRTGIIMPASDGAIMSDIFTSFAFKQARHSAFIQMTKKSNCKFLTINTNLPRLKNNKFNSTILSKKCTFVLYKK